MTVHYQPSDPDKVRQLLQDLVASTLPLCGWYGIIVGYLNRVGLGHADPMDLPDRRAVSVAVRQRAGRRRRRTAGSGP